MRIAHLILAVLFIVLVSACSVTQVKGKIGGVEVEAKNADSKSNSGHFCPPGQAKKGNC